MGSTLTATTISESYDSLLKTTDNGPLTSTLKTVTDGLGNEAPVKLSTDTFHADHISFDDGTTKFGSKILSTSWDMNTDATKAVAHGVTGKENVCVKRIMVTRDDAGNMENPMGEFAGSAGVAGGYFTVDDTNVNITRFASGRYDSADFDAITVYVWIDYVVS